VITLPRISPQAAGLSKNQVHRFCARLEQEGLDVHSFILARGGKVFAEGSWSPYRPDTRHMLFSLSKSFTSVACLFAAEEGLLHLNEKVADLFPDKLPPDPSENLLAMTLSDLLIMAAGQETEPMLYGESDWETAFLRHPVPHPPGSKFMYNTPATYMAGAAVQRRSGQSLVEYLGPRLFQPLGIDGTHWETCPRGLNTAGYGLSITVEDIAKFGVFLLQEGEWEGRRLLPAEAIRAATRRHVSNGDDPLNDWNQGYGFQFWMCRHGAYRGDGAFGQFCVVHPETGLTAAITSGTHDLQGVLNTLYEEILLRLEAPGETGGESVVAGGLELKGPKSTVDKPPLVGTWSFGDPGEFGIRTLSLQMVGDELQATIVSEAGSQTLYAGNGRWGRTSSLSLEPPRWGRWGDRQPSLAHGWMAWTSEEEFAIRVAYIETPFSPTWRFSVAGDRLVWKSTGAISLFDPEEREVGVGEPG
jgi:CubicO group peptidase (beta-lactamase class C family)